MKRIIFIIQLLSGMCCSAAYSQGNATITKAVEQLKTFSSTHITEKAYLHFDKPYYAAGDSIYFKAYLTLGEDHKLSNLSGVLHVDFINTNNKIDQSLKLQIINGVAWGDFALPDTLPKGNYRIRAYTQWMRNDGETSLSDQIIPVGSLLHDKITENSSTNRTPLNTKADIQFFPEGGSLITGICSKVAFKAIDANGQGINVKGVITDNENKEIYSFTSKHLGMGYFYINPAEGRIYKAKITYPNGTQDIVDLPKAVTKGVVLSINNDSIPKASVRIEANKTFFLDNKNNDYFILIYSKGIVTTLNCKLDSQVITFDILKRHLHTGIATVTLFSATGEPLCERLLFMQNYDQLNLDVRSDKSSYARREKIDIKLNANTRAGSHTVGHFSVSVVDEGKVTVDNNMENTILTNLLLTSDLKGFVEQPNYYFDDKSSEARTNLDVLMLTQGYRKFEWKQLLNGSYPPILYQPENNLEVAGTVKSLLGRPIVNGTVSLISLQGGPILSRQTDNKGNFLFSNLVFIDTGRFELNATNDRGKNLTRITYKEESKPPVSVKNLQIELQDVNQVMSTYLENHEKQQEQLNILGLGKGKMLKEVNIKSTKIEKPTIHYRYGVADQVINGNKIQYGGSLSVRLMGQLHGINFIPAGTSFFPELRRNLPGIAPMKIIWNDQEMPFNFDINSINTGSIEKVEAITNATAGPNGILIITTTNGLQPKDVASAGILSVTANGFYKSREFYAPKYDHPEDGFNHRDLRTTIYWNPEIQTDKDGNASFEYYNADGTGNYRVVIEGIDEKGNLGRQVYRYKVE
jgi:hypothetical protein